MLLALLQSIQNLGFFVYLRSSGYLYPVILALHLSTISLFWRNDRSLGFVPAGLDSPADVRRGCGRGSPDAEAHRFCGRSNVRSPSILLQSRAVLLQRLLPHQIAFVGIGGRSRAVVPKSSLQFGERNGCAWATTGTGAPGGSSISCSVGWHSHRRQSYRICARAKRPSFLITRDLGAQRRALNGPDAGAPRIFYVGDSAAATAFANRLVSRTLSAASFVTKAA